MTERLNSLEQHQVLLDDHFNKAKKISNNEQISANLAQSAARVGSFDTVFTLFNAIRAPYISRSADYEIASVLTEGALRGGKSAEEAIDAYAQTVRLLETNAGGSFLRKLLNPVDVGIAGDLATLQLMMQEDSELGVFDELRKRLRVASEHTLVTLTSAAMILGTEKTVEICIKISKLLSIPEEALATLTLALAVSGKTEFDEVIVNQFQAFKTHPKSKELGLDRDNNVILASLVLASCMGVNTIDEILGYFERNVKQNHRPKNIATRLVLSLIANENNLCFVTRENNGGYMKPNIILPGQFIHVNYSHVSFIFAGKARPISPRSPESIRK